MKKSLLLLGLSGLLLTMGSGCFITPDSNSASQSQVYYENSDNDYNQAYQDGYDQAYQDGYDQAYQDGYNQAYQSGMMPPRHMRCGMSDNQFANLKQAVKSESFSDDKINVIQSAASSGNTFLVSQVIEIMNTMSFDDDKVAAATAMYPNVCDTNNWYLVYDALTFSSSKDTLRNKTEASGMNHQPAYNHQQSYNNQSHHPGMMPPPPRQCGMTSSQFSNFKQSVNSASFSDDKKQVIRSAASSNSFLVSQVIEIMKIMTFDDDKVDAAATLYPSVCDKNNWYLVYNELSFSSSKDTLRNKVGQ